MPEKNKLRILFICLGNICRSPAAEGIMKSMVKAKGLDDQIYVDSAGIGSWHIGQLPDIRMRRQGERSGYRFDSRARQFNKGDFARFDLIVVMDADNYIAISSMASSSEDRKKIVLMADYLGHHPGQTSIPDPYYGDQDDFKFVIELLEDACETLLKKLRRSYRGVKKEL